MWYSTIEQRKLSADFDYLADTAREALALEKVRQGLGVAAGRLRREAEELFLPNIRHGVASKPRGVADGMALIPVKRVAARHLLYLDSSLLEQTERRQRANGQSLRPDHPSLPLQGSPVKEALATTTVRFASHHDFISRPIIVAERRLARDAHLASAAAAIVTHELVHGMHFESSPRRLTSAGGDLEGFARFELPAYFAGRVVFEALSDSQPPSRQAVSMMETTMEVQRISGARLDTDGELPATPNQDVIDYMAEKLARGR